MEEHHHRERKRGSSESSMEGDTHEFDKSGRSGASSDRSSMDLPEPRQFVPESPLDSAEFMDRERELAMTYEYDAEGINYRKLFSTGTEVSAPVRARVRGKIPEWLSGTLLRNGPGQYEVGLDSYNHFFDPLAMIQRFHIDPKGRVFYTAQFLQSETYRKNQGAGKIVVGEFGTAGQPDPKKKFFARYISHLLSKDLSDNSLHNFILYGDDVYTTNDSGLLNKINWDTRSLGTSRQENLKKYVAINMITSHPHYDIDGNVYNIGTGNSSYYFIKIPRADRPRSRAASEPGSPEQPPETPTRSITQKSISSDRSPFSRAQVIGGVPFQNGCHACYHHSFGMSENHFAFFEIPLFLNSLKFKFRNFTEKSLTDCLEWNPKRKTLIHLVHVSGRRVKMRYKADPFFLFHHINSYEESGCVILDVVAYRDSQVLKRLELNHLKNGTFPAAIERPQAWRFVLPLELHADAKYGDDLLKWTHLRSRAKAILQKDESIICHPELLTDKCFEYPRINYGMKNGQKYRYCYGTEVPVDGSALYGSKILKIDVEKHKSVEWRRENHHQFAGEPVFVPRPGATEEDDGLILATVSSIRPGGKSFLLFLDAHSFHEVARAELNITIPLSFHGEFLGKVRMFFDQEMSEYSDFA